IGIELLNNAMADLAGGAPQLWPLAYVPVAFGLALAWLFLWSAAHRGLYARHMRRSPA
ncbi:hypothetical protein LCGC14_3013860, partial [marine sediment metagenome]